jgi:DNA replicative helicase MCM subunit Mcm2 (Cdc46/Mcm family)
MPILSPRETAAGVIMPMEYTDEDLSSRWEEFFEAIENRVKVTEVADRFPELRSVYITYADLDRFDPDMASYVLDNPDRALAVGEQAIRKMAQQGKGDAAIHLRLKELPKDSLVDIRMLRSDHLGKLISVEGLVRKATEVRPKVTEARFRCFRCGCVIVEEQDGLIFKEPLECYKDQNGCGRTSSSTKFSLLTEESQYIDTQKIEMQENPEGLRGGAQPERLSGFLEDDLAGKVSPGDRVQMNGVLRSVQKGSQGQKSTLFDINLDVLSVESKDQEYEEVEITAEDEEAIIHEARSPEVFNNIVKSISPTIYGYNEVKEAIALQLFGGSHKKLDDGTKVRGDIHILLVGDPGVAKCVVGETMVSLPDGNCRTAQDLVEEALSNGGEDVDDGTWAPMDLGVMTFSRRGAVEAGRAIRAWKRTSPRELLRFTTESGRQLTVTPTHPLFIANGQWILARHAERILVGQAVAVAAHAGRCGPSEDVGYSRGLDWDKVVSIERVPGRDWVYDLEVEDSHIFVANGILSHNSQMLRYMADAAPRGIYASGKASSAAGLCVAPDAVITVDGKAEEIGGFVERHMPSPEEAGNGVQMQGVYINGVETLSDAGSVVERPVTAVFRLPTPPFLVEMTTESGLRLSLTPETQVLVVEAGFGQWKHASDVTTDDVLVTLQGEGMARKTEWSRVKGSRKIVDDLPPHVYDITVEKAHAFVANGILVHNTAAAVKDDFGDGRWTLEAGALVLADRGLACIAEGEMVQTIDGLLAIEAVRPGMKVFQMGRGGLSLAEVRRVICNGERETVLVSSSSGDSIECTADHRILTARGWVEAGRLGVGDALIIPFDAGGGEVRDERAFESGFFHGSLLSDKRDDFDGAARAPRRGNRKRQWRRLRPLCLGGGANSKGVGHAARTVASEGRRAPSCSEDGAPSRPKDGSASWIGSLPLGDRDFCLGLLAGAVSVIGRVAPRARRPMIKLNLGRADEGGPSSPEQKVLTSALARFGVKAEAMRGGVLIGTPSSCARLASLVWHRAVGANRGKLRRMALRDGASSGTTPRKARQRRGAGISRDTLAEARLGRWMRNPRAVRDVAPGQSITLTGRAGPKEAPGMAWALGNGCMSVAIRGVSPGRTRKVYDLTMDGEPNFLLTGGVVHNCIDELDKMTDQDRSSMHEAMESQCYDEETEVLTDSGWKGFRDLDHRDLIATMDEGRLVYERPVAHVDAAFDGLMHRFSSPEVDLLVTPNHNMYVDKGDGFRLQRADSLREGDVLRFRRHAEWEGKEVEGFELPSSAGTTARIPMDAWLHFLGHFLARGRLRRRGRGKVVVLEGPVDEPEMRRIFSCISQMGARHAQEGRGIAVFSEALVACLEAMGGLGARRVPRTLMSLSKRQLSILLDAMVGRPWRRGRSAVAAILCTQSRGLADDVQELALKVGKVAQVRESARPAARRVARGGRALHRGGFSIVSVRDAGEALEPLLERPGDKQEWEEEYHGRVYCVEVPHHIIFVRRRGTPVWCGNTVSVAKAGITATLQCRCSMLGAANPKYGRFDDTEPLANQINMPPALLSRFDLIFALTDKPNLDRDTKIAQHIIKGHLRGEVLRLPDPSAVKEIDYEKILSETSNIRPVYTSEFMRKFVKYSKRIVPVMSDEAQAIIRDKYLSIRKQGETPGASISITARQLEAFIRLSEASARIRLSSVVAKEDAQRAVRIVEYYLGKMAKEGDMIDVDKVMTGTTRSDRHRISIMRQLINDNSDPATGVSEAVLFQRAAEKGLNETDVRDSLKRLKMAGDIFEVSRGHFKLVHGD